MDYSHWWGPHLHWFWIVPVLFMIIMCAFAARLFRRVCVRRSGSGHRGGWMPVACWQPRQDRTAYSWPETAREILDRRYASGEITKEQYVLMKRDIESGRSSSGPEQEQKHTPRERL